MILSDPRDATKVMEDLRNNLNDFVGTPCDEKKMRTKVIEALHKIKLPHWTIDNMSPNENGTGFTFTISVPGKPVIL